MEAGLAPGVISTPWREIASRSGRQVPLDSSTLRLLDVRNRMSKHSQASHPWVRDQVRAAGVDYDTPLPGPWPKAAELRGSHQSSVNSLRSVLNELETEQLKAED